MENPDKWNSEEKRLERKERLNSLKARDGGKKPIKTNSKFLRIFVPILAAVLVVAIGIWGVIALSIPQKIFTPLTVGSNKISTVEFSYYYASVLRNLSIDNTTAAGVATLGTACTIDGYTDKTWQEYAFEMTAKTITELQVQYDEAIAAGMSLTADEKTQIDTMFEDLITQVGDKVAADQYLISLFGAGVTVDTLKPVFEKQTLVSDYATKQTDAMEATDAEISEEYNNNKDTYDTVTIRMSYFAVETKTDATDKEKEEFDAEAKAAAEVFLASATSEDMFKTLYTNQKEGDEAKAAAAEEAAYKAEYEAMTDEEKAAADEKKELEKTQEKAAKEAEAAVLASMTTEERAAYDAAKANEDPTLVSGIAKSKLDNTSTDMGTWCFDASRKAGDKSAFSVDGGYYVVYFVQRDANMTLPTVRHILVSPNKDKDVSNGDVFTVDEWDAARTAAEALLAKCTSEDAFVSLVADNSSDTGSSSTGGLYENIFKNTMVQEFSDWIYDSSRKADDVAIVRSVYGYHVMWFVGNKATTPLSRSESTIKTTIKSNKYSEWLSTQTEKAEYKYTLNSFGLKLFLSGQPKIATSSTAG